LPRIPFPDEGDLSPEQMRVIEKIVAGPRGILVGPLRAALHRPDLADAWQHFGAMLRYDTSLPPRLSELAIIVTARRWNSQLEWHVHAAAALKAGLPAPVVDAILAGEAPGFADETEAEIYEFTRELQLTGQVADATYERVKDRWGALGVVELTTLIGYYTLVSMTLNAHHIPLPAGAAPALGLDGPCPEDPALDVRLAPIPSSRLHAVADRPA
jgi:4-carboxymuconolactone decarboxylase